MTDININLTATHEFVELSATEQQIIDEYLTIAKWEDEQFDQMLERELYMVECELAVDHTDFDEVEKHIERLLENIQNYSFDDLVYHYSIWESGCTYYVTHRQVLVDEMKLRVKKNPLLALKFPLELLGK